VFNCDEGLDYKAMGRIFIGLVKCGAWGCFDEFNRLLEEQLSAISQQIQVIQWAIKEQAPALELLGRTIPVNKNAGIFVTMNPLEKVTVEDQSFLTTSSSSSGQWLCQLLILSSLLRLYFSQKASSMPKSSLPKL